MVGGSSPPLTTKGWSFSVPPPPIRVLEHSILAFFEGIEKGWVDMAEMVYAENGSLDEL